MQEKFALSLNDIYKSFGGIKALNGVNFELKKGEVHALLGENGAGKSTLIKIITGVYSSDRGTMFINGQKVQIGSPVEARKNGIGAIYQELSLVDSLTVAENIFLGNEPVKPPFSYYDRKSLYRKCGEYLKQFEIDIPLNKIVGSLGMGQKRVVEIVKALVLNAQILLLDEPTTGMSQAEINILFQIVRNLKKNGISMIYISHYLDEVFDIADRATVFRDGSYISTYDIKNVTKAKLISDMIGHSLHNDKVHPQKKLDERASVLRLYDFQSELMKKPITMEIHRTEIVGITGIIGAGKSELALSIFGAGGRHLGKMELNGKKVNLRSPVDAARHHIALIPEDRKSQGLFLTDSVENNIMITNIEMMQTAVKTVDNRKKYKLASDICRKLQVFPNDIKLIAGHLSGGNQQKIVLAKWLLNKPELIIMDEPTRGIDVGAKQEIYDLILRLSEDGAAILVMSSECEELIDICDKILVLYRGEIVREFAGSEVTKENLMTCSLGGSA